MPHTSEEQLVAKLLERTKQEQVDWQPTAIPGQLTASFAGKYTILLTGGGLLGAVIGATLKVKNADGDELVSLDSLHEPRLPPLYALAEQFVRKHIDNQLADLMKEIDNPLQSDESAKRARLIEKIRESKGRLSDMK
jgi:hypothetical protein